MFKLIGLAVVGYGLYRAYLWVRSSSSDYAAVARVLIWGEERPRRPHE